MYLHFFANRLCVKGEWCESFFILLLELMLFEYEGRQVFRMVAVSKTTRHCAVIIPDYYSL